MRKHYIVLFWVGILFLPFTTKAQETSTSPVGRFKADSTKVGEVVHYALTYRHDPDMEVFFPDSTYDFSPFEYMGKEYFPTVTDITGSLDSVVYELTTFELDELQELSVPVILMQNAAKADTIYPEKDGVYLQKVVLSMPDSVKLMENANLATVPKQFNYPYYLIALGVLLLLGLIVLLVFGKQIKKNIVIRRLQRTHTKFVEEYSGLTNGNMDVEHLEKALGIWKSYTGKVKNMPLQSCTTREISALVSDQNLGKSLKELDKAIYAGIRDGGVPVALNTLKQYAETAYEQKIQEVRNG
ncbi:hypothetical protein V6R21_27975 [Limibacter armeniacum]|uniref:hypothetical protein n=1 Tax=Limibacter armeniacum TaxID=466084 RepID=UPI002FE58F7A